MDDSVHLPAAAYALDALERDEVAAFESHLAGCAQCRDDVRTFAETAARLGSADQVAPSARTKEQVLSRIASTPQLPALDEPAAPAAVRTLHKRPRRSAPLVLAAAAVLLAVVAASLGVLLAHARSQESAAVARARAVAAVVAASDAQTSRGAVQGGGRAAVVVSATQEAAVFLADGLAQPAPDHVYELWFIDAAGAARPAGTFVPGADGTAAQRMNGTPQGAALVGLTVEPGTGSAQPTTTPVVALPVAG